MVKKSLLKKFINEEIKELLSNPPSHSFEKSNRKIINTQDKIELLQYEYTIIDKEIKKLSKLLKDDPNNDLYKRKISKNEKLKKEITLQIQKNNV